MRLPRDLSGTHLASLLERYDYRISRQTGSHIRLTRAAAGSDHHVTIPAHKALKLGTLHGILKEVSRNLNVEMKEIQAKLFG